MNVNLHQAKTHLSRYITMVQQGKNIVICKHNVPIAELHPIQKTQKKRKIGQCKDAFTVPDSFYEPLPKDVLNAFNNPS